MRDNIPTRQEKRTTPRRYDGYLSPSASKERPYVIEEKPAYDGPGILFGTKIVIGDGKNA